MRRVLALTIALAAVLAGPAGADGTDHTHRPVVVGIEPPVDGLAVEVRAEPAPTLVLRNATGERVEVQPIVGYPFLRIGPDAVEANVRSPQFFHSESPSAYGVVPPSADAGEPRWVQIADGAEWAWFEHRISLAGFDEPWRIPIRVGDVDAEIVGRWEPIATPGQVVSTIDPIDIDGLYVAILEGQPPGLYVGNDTGEPFVVDDPHGEPFLRIGPTRTTRATPGGDAEVVAPTPSYGWIDARVGWPGDPPDGAATRAWEVPARLGDRELVLTGTVAWVPIEPADDGGGFPWLGVGAVVVAALAAAAWVVTRRDESA